MKGAAWAVALFATGCRAGYALGLWLQSKTQKTVYREDHIA